MQQSIILLKKLLSAIVFFILISFQFLLISCNEQPTELGADMLPDTLEIFSVSSQDTNLIRSSQTLVETYGSILRGRILLGEYDNNGEKYESHVFLRFGLLPNYLGDLNDEDIKSAVLTLTPTWYAFGDTISNNLSFNIYELLKIYGEDLNWDSVYSAPGVTDYYDDSRILGNWGGQIELNDTAKTEINIDISPVIINKWLKLRSDTTNKEFIDGLALIPNTATNVIRQFYTNDIQDQSSPVPYITFVYSRNDTLDTMKIESAVESYVINVPKVPDNYITLQGSVAYRGDLEIVASMIPAFSAIHVADLELTLNKELSRFSNQGMDSVLRAAFYADTLADSSKSVWRYEAGVKEGTLKYYFPRINSFFEVISRREGKGVINLQYGRDTYREVRQIDRYVFHGFNDPDTSKRPKIRVIYSPRPDFREYNK